MSGLLDTAATGLLDTSVVIDLSDPAVAEALPEESAVSAITLAELSWGASKASDAVERAARQMRLQELDSRFAALPFDAVAARSYGPCVAAVASIGRTHRSRIADLMTAATAHANGLVLYTRNPDDFKGLESLIQLVSI